MKRIITVVLCLFVLFPAVAFSENGDFIVYITKSGTKYHLDGCPSLRSSKIPITLSEAIAQGYEPCSRCNPPTLVSTDSQLTSTIGTSIDLEALALPYCRTPENIVHHTGYSLLYSEENEQAVWVAYVLTAEEVAGNFDRNDNFRADSDIVTGSASLSDYKGSGYDRGHLAPAADLKWSRASMNDSFYLSNMSPQAPGFNRGVWKKLEEWVREEATAERAVCVVTGPILTDGPYETIGGNGVTVPKRYYKVLLDW
ncbi:DNA/RNA non-specific endonuclease [Sediminispirochaeta smaragdinae]|uniref:Endonuclease n=1 Tax=Sediminispirochaeta smaragdinae (strain DSM 11293 / JCM 15392 / SEBR 4228) TaxID=573413 RepID=E1R1E3_SEDSS|nr:DNA/RNA non-specific endonuclease [Sediminispirochaeta smaragdinae]ADK81084.1 DNA/RNA non-specific endonuclease [Sediminispirochaeta smaragdinae DSM 11293]